MEPTTELARRSIAAVRELKGGADRPGQIDMIVRVAEVIDGVREQATVEAPTGTGKSVATLVPAILSGKKVVYLTATKMLQDQLAEDLDMLRALRPDLSYVILKGRSAYVCPARLAELTDTDGKLFDAAASGVSVAIRQVADWARTSDGDLDAAGIVLEPADREAVTCPDGECPGKKCNYAEVCPALAVRRRAQSANVIVTNMAMYAAHVSSGGMVLPDHDLLIVDEMHKLLDVMSENLGLTISGPRLRKTADRCLGLLANLNPAPDTPSARTIELDRVQAEDLTKLATEFGDVLARQFEIGKAGDGLLDMPLPDELVEIIGRIERGVGRCRNAIERHYGTTVAADPWGVDDDGEPGATEVVIEDQAALRTYTLTGKILDQIESIDLVVDMGALYVEAVGKGRSHALRGVLVDVAHILRAQIWDQVPAVLCSATVPIKSSSKLGLTVPSMLRVETPFDLERNAAFYLATELGDPRRPGWQADVIDETEQLIRAAGGRALVLCSSFKAMEHLAFAMRSRLRGTGIEILAQGEGMSNPALTRKFAASETACLFGSQGLYEGINVPGSTCSLVIIDKIPFSAPNDPLTAARCKAAGDDWFSEVMIPRARVLFSQAVGRLIRTVDDRGLVACFDGRLGEKSYGPKIMAAAKPMRQIRHVADACDYLRKVTATANSQAGLEAIGF